MKKEKILFYATILLSIFGVIMVYSSSYIWAEYKYNNPYKYLISQSLFVIMGIILMIIISKINYKIYKEKAKLIIGICFLLLVLVLIPGIGTVRNGSRSWFGIGGLGIQPSELAKIGLIIFCSKYLEKNNKYKKNTKDFILPIMLVIIVFFGLILLQPDFGTGMVIVCSLIGLLFITGTKLGIFVKLGILGLIGIIVLVLIAPYRLERITSYLNPWSDPLGSGFQIIQSLYAIGPGGLLGFGLGASRQKHFYLPEPQTDFIFSIIAEEFGFLGCLIVVSLFAIIFITAIKIALGTNDLFGKYLCFGLIFMLIFQAALNLMVVTGIIPITGVTLPFLSYGGSSLLVSMISIGIILNISKNNIN